MADRCEHVTSDEGTSYCVLAEAAVARAERAEAALRDGAWLVRLARGSSWPGEMAERVEQAANRYDEALRAVGDSGEGRP